MPFPQFNVLMANRRPTQGHFHYYERQFYDLAIKIQLFININYDFIIWSIIEFILATKNVTSGQMIFKKGHNLHSQSRILKFLPLNNQIYRTFIDPLDRQL